jgi:hypothetical protein
MVANLYARLLEALAMKLVTTLSVLVGLLSLLSWATSAPGALADDKKDGEQNKDAALQGAWKVEIHDTRGQPASKQFQVTDTGLKELAGLKSLQVLMLSKTQVTAAGVAWLQKELPVCRISR